ncbi:MAG: DUF1330 domain-containing protein [Bacteroidales bacterium]|nr:DUF1330 domain-containing protein [Bacteroidales bacterium]
MNKSASIPMNYYFVAQIKIKDEDEYQKYISKCDDIFSRYKGKYLAVDNQPKLLEGKWSYTRTVIIQFPSEENFNEWYYSPEYQEILKHRLHSARCDTILVKGHEL